LLSGAINYQATTPGLFVLNNISIAAEIGVCTLIAWLFFRQGIGWLVSVVGRFRWRWFFITVGVFAAGYVVLSGVIIGAFGLEGYGCSELSTQPYTWFMLAAIVFTTPFQCAGEEFQSRALLPRLIAAIVPVRWLSLTLSALVPSLIFMLLHDAQDPWLNLNYFCVALMMWWLAYRTGGIEASIGLHLVNNLFSEWYLPFTNIGGMFDRSVGTGSSEVLVNLGFQLALVVIVDVLARQRGLVRESSPGAVDALVVAPRRWMLRAAEATRRATPADLAPYNALAALPPPSAPVLVYPPPYSGYAPYWYTPPPPVSRAHNGLGVASLIAGVAAWAGLVAGFALLTASELAGTMTITAALTAAVVAVACGGPGIDAARHQEATNKAAATAGLVLGVVPIGLTCLALLLAYQIGGL